MTVPDSESSEADDVRGGEWAEALIMDAYRCAVAGFCSDGTQSWDAGWRLLGEALPAGEVEPLFGQFRGFARALLAAAQRPLSCHPVACPGRCFDEALALRMIETAQCADHVGMLSAASALLGVDDLGGALQAAQSLAAALARRGIVVRASAQREACGFDLCPSRRLH